jgi:ubiquitin-protein ligase
VWVVDGFEHFHVFAGGKVCFKLLNKENWKLGYSILMLVNGIIKMLHSDPEVSDPASTSLPRLVEKGESRYHQPNLKDYNAFLKAQAKRFANRYEAEVKSFCVAYGIKPREHELRDRFMDDE